MVDTIQEDELQDQPDYDQDFSQNGELPIATVEEILTEDDVNEEFEHVKLPSGKGYVVIRALTRFEMLSLEGKKFDKALLEAKLVSICMVKPKMTIKQVTAWQKKKGNIADIHEVAKAISRKSGMTIGTPKSVV